MKYVKSLIQFVLLTSAWMIITSPGYAREVTLGVSGEQAMQVSKPALFPEDIKYNTNTGRFILGSFREGAVYELDQQGRPQLLVQDDKLVSVLGVQIDPARNRLYVATANLGASVKQADADTIKKLAGLGIYNLSTGKAVQFIDLGRLLPNKPHLANGITVDIVGNVYVTDSFSPVIYRVTADGEASIFHTDEAFKGQGIGLNGLVYHPDGYLIVAKKDDGRLFKVPTDKPETMSEIKLPQPLIGIDGVTLVNQQEIVVTANRASGVNTNASFALFSSNQWKTATITGTHQYGDVYPTATVVRKGKIYGMYSKIGDLVKAAPEEKAGLKVKAVIQPIGRIEKPAG